MQNSIKHYSLLLILASLLSGCVTAPPRLITNTDVAVIPRGLLVLPEMPEIATDPLTIEEALELGKELRIYGCFLHSNTKEIVRYATLGDTVIDDLSDEQCEDLN